MYKKYHIFLFDLIFFSLTVFGQKLSGIIVDAESKIPISYATIINLKSMHGLYSTENGKFEITINKGDSLRISCIGYKPVTISGILNKKYDLDTVFLNPESKNMSEVIITSINWNEYKEKKIGYSGIKSIWHIGGLTGFEYAAYIPNDKKLSGAYICNLLYKIVKKRTDTVVVRLHLYSVNTGGTPGNELLDSNYFVLLTGKMDKTMAFDITSLKIKFPNEGIFVGFEWLGTYDSKSNSILFQQIYEPVIKFNDKLSSGITYGKTPNGKWEKPDPRMYYKNSDIEKLVFSRNVPNASFGMTIKIPKKK